MAEQHGARPHPDAPVMPGAYAQPPSRPFRKASDGTFPVAADNTMVPNLRANMSNNNQDSNKAVAPKPGAQSGKGGGDGVAKYSIDEATMQPEGKPYAG